MSPYFLSLIALVAAPLAHTQILTAGFDSPEYNTDNAAVDVAGQNGWVINDPTPDISFFVLFGYTGSAPDNHGAAIGGYLDTPVEPFVELSNTYGGPLADSILSLKFAVPSSSDAFPGRDTFGWSFRDELSNSLFHISLEPNLSFNDRLEVVWYDSAHTRTSTGFDLFYDSTYDLTVRFDADGPNTLFSANIDGADDLPFTGTLPGAADATLETFGLSAQLAPGNTAYGDNFLLVDNLSVRAIPESGPGLIALIPMVSGALLLRRRSAESRRPRGQA